MTDETCSCKVCGVPTPMLGTRLCDPCWELSGKLRDGLHRRLLRKLHLREGHLPEGLLLVDALSREVFGNDR